MECTIFCHICRTPTDGAGVCEICLKDLPLESEIKKEDNIPPELSVLEIKEAEQYLWEWLKLGKDLLMDVYNPQISFQTFIAGK